MERMHDRLRNALVGHAMGLTLCAALIGVGFGFIFLLFGYPSTAALAMRYFRAVRRGNAEQAANLADTGCRRLVREYAQEDIAQFGKSEVRNVSLRVGRGTGSDDRFEYATIDFEYRTPNQGTWQQETVVVGATQPSQFSFRHLTCGGWLH